VKKLVTGRLHYYDPADQIVLMATITGNPSLSDLSDAIQKAVRKHAVSSLGIVIGPDGESRFQPVPQRDAPVSIVEAECDLERLLNEQHGIPFDAAGGEFFRFFLFRQSEKTQLVIVANHLAGDGLSIVFLLRDIMTALEHPCVAYPMQPLQLMEDFGYPADSEPMLLPRLAIKRINQQWNKDKRAFGRDEYLDMYRSYWSGRRLKLVCAELSGQDLQGLIKRCKQASVTINSALTAAFLFALPTCDAGMAVSVRPEGYEGLGNFVSGISVQYRWDAKRSFWSNVRTVHETIYQKLNNPRKKYYVLQSLKRVEPTLIDAMYFTLYAGFQNRMAQTMLDLSKYSEKRRHTLSLTNLARPKIPADYGNYALSAVAFVPPLIATSRMMLGVVTLGDRMTITMQYEETDRSKDYDRALSQAVAMLKTQEPDGLRDV